MIEILADVHEMYSLEPSGPVTLIDYPQMPVLIRPVKIG